jgi:hypothetical protein
MNRITKLVASLGKNNLGEEKKYTFTVTDNLSLNEEENLDLLEWNLNEIKTKIAEFLEQGKLSNELLEVISQNKTCAPVEYELLDYKETLNTSAYGYAKIILTIASFYNSLGGYIVFGVSETQSETRFDIVGFDETNLNLEKLKGLVKEYTGIRIQINSISIPYENDGTSDLNVTFLHVPKRPDGERPVQFLKNSPENDKKKCIFNKDDVYYRKGDECLQAKGNHIFELAGKRNNPYLANTNQLQALIKLKRISHNLPDRNFICPEFVGRENIVNTLWTWLADDLSHIKIIAGEGGLGKSSVAYEFVERVSRANNAPYDQIVWLTAKEQQFRASSDKYENTPERHYSSYLELLSAICDKLPYTHSELDGATESELIRMIKKGLVETTSLIVIDDVDSLTREDQRKTVEIGQYIGASESKILFTTRNNEINSINTVIHLEGLPEGDDFNEFVYKISGRLKVTNLASSDISKIYQTTLGSPLFTESLLRLLRWTPLNEALAQWKGEKGVNVRAAALKREINSLSTESKRLILVIALMVEASVVELQEVLAYNTEIIEGCLNELDSLFLIAAPEIASTPRFRVPANTRRLVLDEGTKLVTDRVKLESEVSNFKKRTNKKPPADQRVASAISQAESFLRSGDLNKALDTVKDAKKSTKNHFDLLSYEASLLLKHNPPRNNEARNLARQAFDKGCRKSELFETWFEAEFLSENFNGAIEAADAALNLKDNNEWQIRKAVALSRKADNLGNSGNFDSATRTMFEASKLLKLATSVATRDEVTDIRSKQFLIHDQIWIWPINESGFIKAAAQLDILENMRKYGDYRGTNKKRVLATFSLLASYIDKLTSSFSSSQLNLLSTLRNKADALIKNENDHYPDKSISDAWSNIQTKIAIALER